MLLIRFIPLWSHPTPLCPELCSKIWLPSSSWFPCRLRSISSISLYINIVVLLPDLWSSYSTTHLSFQYSCSVIPTSTQEGLISFPVQLSTAVYYCASVKLTKPAGTPIVIANLAVTEASSASLLHLQGVSDEFALLPFTPMHLLSGKELWVPEEGVCPRSSMHPGIIGHVVQMLNTCSSGPFPSEGPIPKEPQLPPRCPLRATKGQSTQWLRL